VNQSIINQSIKQTISQSIINHPLTQSINQSSLTLDQQKVQMYIFHGKYQSMLICSDADASENEMSLLDFPFLFDPASKVLYYHGCHINFVIYLF